jgi:hypothetical protein
MAALAVLLVLGVIIGLTAYAYRDSDGYVSDDEVSL